MQYLLPWLAIVVIGATCLIQYLGAARSSPVVRDKMTSAPPSAKEPRPRTDANKPPIAPSPLAAILLQHGLSQNGSVEVAESLAASFDILMVSCDEEIDCEQYALSFVVTGSVHAKLTDYSGDEDLVLKVVSAGGPLTTSLQTLSHLVHQEDYHTRISSKILSAISSTDFTLHAAADTVIAVLPVATFHEHLKILPEEKLQFVDVLLRKLYFATLPFSQTYLGMQQSILEYEESMSNVDIEGREAWHDLDGHLHALHKIKFKGLFSPTTPGMDPKFESMGSQLSDLSRQPLIRNDTTLDETLNAAVTDASTGTGLRIKIPKQTLPSRSDTGTDLVLPSALTQLEGRLATFSRTTVRSAAQARTVRRIVSQLLYEALDINLALAVSPTAAELSPQSEAFISLVDLCHFQKDTLLAKQGQRLPGIYLIVDGEVEMHATSRTKRRDSKVLTVGSVLGFSSVLINSRSIFDLRAVSDVYAGFLSRQRLSELRARNIDLLPGLARRVLTRLPPLIRHVHYACDYATYATDQPIYREGDESHSFYLVMSGRLRTASAIQKFDSTQELEFGKGQSAGALELYTGRRRPSALIAIRKSQVVQMQKSSFKALAHNNPSMAFRFSEIIAHSAPLYIEQASNAQPKSNDDSTIQTIAIVPISASVPVKVFARHLVQAIKDLGLAKAKELPVLCDPSLKSSLSVTSQSSSIYRDSILENYLLQVEDNAPLVIYLANDYGMTSWSTKCCAHADVILFVGSVDDKPTLMVGELDLAHEGRGAHKKLVLLHPTKRHADAGLASKWLTIRPWVNAGIQHVHMPLANNPSPVRNGSATITAPLRAPSADFDRLARRILGKSIALVLGGGGARGVAHLGVVKALEENGIPVDIIGGTSMGSYIGAVMAKSLSWEVTLETTRHISLQLRPWKFLLDITYPWLAITTGRRFNNLIKADFHNMDLEDTWLEYYCSVTNLSSQATSKVYASGSAWEAIRASMSYVGFVPPLWKDGELVMDGCYSNNVPISHAAALKADTIFAIDVGPDKTISTPSWGNELSSWSMIIRKYFPSKTHPPQYQEVVEILSEAQSQADLRISSAMANCHYTRMPVGMYKAIEFAKFDEIYEIGYAHATQWLKTLRVEGKLGNLCLPTQAAGT
jgi:predicted acylesterase/phospholipase RssA/CRP-like cAMP-binding protein